MDRPTTWSVLPTLSLSRFLVKLTVVVVVVAACLTMPVGTMSVPGEPCEADFFWDDAVDRCESCRSYCGDYEQRSMGEQCRKLCPDYMQRLAAAGLKVHVAVQGDSESTESSPGSRGAVPTWSVVVIAASVVVVAGGLGFVTYTQIMKKRGVGKCRINGLGYNKPTEQDNPMKLPQRASNEIGLNKIAPGTSAYFIVVFSPLIHRTYCMVSSLLKGRIVSLV